MKNVGFEHLHLHTEQGSLLDGLGRVEEICAKMAELRQIFVHYRSWNDECYSEAN